MKRRVVAMLLSLTLCMGGTLEAGATALSTPDVQVAAESDLGADSFSDETTENEQQSQMDGNDVAEDDTEVTVTPEITEAPEEPEQPEITEAPEVTEPPENTETPEITVTPEVTEAPEVPEEPETTVTPEVTETPENTETPETTKIPEATKAPQVTVTPAADAEKLKIASDKKTVDKGNADIASATGASVVNGVVEAKTSDWVNEGDGLYRLRKKKVSDDMVPEGKTSGNTAESEDVDTLSEDTEQQAVVTEDSENTTEEAGETTDDVEEMTLDNGDAVPAEESAPAEAAATAATVEDSYFTAQDGLLKIKTNGHTGYYLFNEDGYLVTGRMSREPGTAGYTGTQKVEWYFVEKSKATLYSDSQGKAITPWTSNLGQQKKKYWLWTGTMFRYYNANGNFTSVAALKISGKLQKIGSDYYTLDGNGKPYTGIKKLKAGSETFEYYFQPAQSKEDIPGKLFYSGWMYYKNSKGQKRFIYCSPKSSTIGQVMKHGVYVSKVMSKTNTFMLNANGYVLKNTMAKAQNNAYYITDSKGHIIKEKLVKYKGYRYYFGSAGRRATWKNLWHSCPGASGHYYYFGSVAGRVVEKKGWQRVVNGKGQFYGWFYFNNSGNNYKNQMITVGSSKKSYYFTKTGKLASGITKINNKYYFFATSNSNSHRGWLYKNTLIRYKNNWYYANKAGILRKNGWQKVGKYWYYLSNYKVVTNKSIKHGKVSGRLDSQGRFSTGWVVVSDYNNKVRYIDPDSGDKYLTSTSRWIDGKLYYFDRNGYRRNDVSSIYGGPYYLEVDKTNGVMTVYTDYSKKIPVKTIRVSVGLSGTPTWDGTYGLSRSLRWQPLMGPSWGQYGTHVDGCGQGGIFIHSVAGGTRSVYNLPAGEYMKLGNPASHGCIRVCVADAKWVYERCDGSTIHIYSSGKYSNNEAFKGPLGRKPITPLRGSQNFDPTDPAV